MKVEAGTIEELFEASGKFEEGMRTLDTWIMDTVPNAKRQLFAGSSITMMGYGEMDWQDNQGEGVWPVIGVAPQKTNISVYVAAEKNGRPLPSIYTKEVLGGGNNGKHCIRIRNFKKVDEMKMKEAIQDAFSWADHERNRFGRRCASPEES
ncbi:DUF1801 domain-containing protein [Salimicrobium halophilum]|uniref:YdhG-like domain-containing protein n=1 Tax=Salimicrobium halophilum TaxID=86666 RepID=A0A1G8RE93_9BACI|nr:DUF1801 domain-containing protein [Salimicrobium halophilum]SDJ15229.1 hypothetical protein SAMN04490247_0977 [Salimicrobium halophilum]